MANEQTIDLLIKAREITSAAFASVNSQLKELETGVGRTNTTLSNTDKTLTSMYGGLKSAAGLMGIAFSANALVGFVGGVFDAASSIKDMAGNLDISTDAAQEFKFAAEQTGTSMGVVSNAISFMNKSLAEGSKSTVGALKEAGLSFSAIRNMKPEDAFKAIATAIKGIEDPMMQTLVTTELFGGKSKALLAGIREDFVAVGEGAAKMSKETIDRLEEAQDAWGKLADTVTIYSGTIIAEGMRTAEQVTSSWQGFIQFAKDSLEFGAGAALANANITAKVTDGLSKQKDVYLALPGPIRKTKEEQDELNKSQRAGAAAADAYRKSVQDLASTWTSASIDKEILKLSDALKVAAASGDLTDAGVKKLVESYLKLRAQVNPNALPQEMANLDRVTMAYLGTLSKLTVGLDKVPGTFLGVERAINDIEMAIISVTPPLDAFGYLVGTSIGKEALPDAILTIEELLGELEDIGIELPPVIKATGDWGTALGTAAQFAGMFSSTIGGGISIVGDYANAMKAAKDITDETAKSQAQAAAKQQLVTSGMMIYFQFIMSQMAAQDAARAQGLAFAAQLADVNEQLREQYGDFAAAQAAAERYGLALDDVRTKYMTITSAGTSRTGPSGPNDAREVDRFNDQVRDLDEMVKRVASNVERLGLAWTDMPDMEDRLRAAALAAREFITEIDELTRAGYDYDAIVNAMSTDVNEWLSSALSAGVGISDAMRPIIDALIRTGELTDANAMKLLGYVGDAVPSIDEIRAAAEKYGISWEEVEAILFRVAAATKKAADKTALSEMDELLKGSGFKSMRELEKIAADAGRVYAEMVRLGGFSAAEMARAFKAWQDALAGINPALEGAVSGIDRAAAAGYRTKASLEAAAKASGELYEEMRTSGLYTADVLKKAWEDWQADLEAAGAKGAAGMTKALREELKGLTEMLEKEAPEEFMGSIEKAARERVEAIQREAKEASKATMKVAVDVAATLTAGASSSMAITGGVVKNTLQGMQRVGTEGKVAFEWVRDAAGEADDEIKGCWDRSNDFKELLADSDFGAPFRDMGSDVRDTKGDVDALLSSLSRIPGGGTSSRESGYTGSSSSSDFRTGSPLNQAASRAAASSAERQTIIVRNYMNGRAIGESVYEVLPSILRARGVF